MVGCFICALDERVNMGPNKNSFFKDPTEHRKKFHAEKVFAELTRKQNENLRLIQKLLVSDGAEAEPMMTVTTPQIPTKDAPASSNSSSSSSQQTILTGKFCHKSKYRFVDATFTEKLKVNQKCTSDLQKMAKGFCLSVIHNSVNKCISESTTIELYETAYRGIYDHYIVQAEAFEQMRGGTSATTLATPQKCSLNKNNIEVWERNILEAYEASTDSKYSIIKKSTFWGIMHDGIQKFVVEYNGMYIQAVHPDTFKLLLVPFRLMRMHGGVDAHDTIQSLMTAFAEFLDIKDNAFHGIRTKDCFLDINNNDIPTYFNLGTTQNVYDKLFQAENIFTMKLVADLHGVMHNKLERKVDEDDHLVSQTYKLAQDTASIVRTMSTPKSDKFVESLHLDDNGNVMFHKVLNGNDHTLRLTNPHKSNRKQTEEQRLTSMLYFDKYEQTCV